MKNIKQILVAAVVLVAIKSFALSVISDPKELASARSILKNVKLRSELVIALAVVPSLANANFAFAELAPTINSLKEASIFAIPIALLLEMIFYKVSTGRKIKNTAIEINSANAASMLIVTLSKACS